MPHRCSTLSYFDAAHLFDDMSIKMKLTFWLLLSFLLSQTNVVWGIFLGSLIVENVNTYLLGFSRVITVASKYLLAKDYSENHDILSKSHIIDLEL